MVMVCGRYGCGRHGCGRHGCGHHGCGRHGCGHHGSWLSWYRNLTYHYHITIPIIIKYVYIAQVCKNNAAHVLKAHSCRLYIECFGPFLNMFTALSEASNSAGNPSSINAWMMDEWNRSINQSMSQSINQWNLRSFGCCVLLSLVKQIHCEQKNTWRVLSITLLIIDPF